jgi:hypothetical protein
MGRLSSLGIQWHCSHFRGSTDTMTLGSWIGATSLGWIAGIPVLILTGGVFGPIGLGNTAIAMSMGAGIAFFQWLVLRKRVSRAHRWLWVNPMAFAMPFMASDLLIRFHAVHAEYAIITATLIGSCILALAQQQVVLKTTGLSLVPWMAVNLAAYAVAIAPPFLLTVGRINQLHLPEVISVTLSFVTVLAGGPVIGFLTGLVLVRHFKA